MQNYKKTRQAYRMIIWANHLILIEGKYVGSLTKDSLERSAKRKLRASNLAPAKFSCSIVVTNNRDFSAWFSLINGRLTGYSQLDGTKFHSGV